MAAVTTGRKVIRIMLKFVLFNWTTEIMVAAWLDDCLPFRSGKITLPQSEFILPCVWMALKLSHCQARQKSFDSQTIVSMLWKNIQLVCRDV